MIGALLFAWIGIQLNAPAWFYVLCGVMLFGNIIDLSVKVYKKGQESNSLEQ